MAQTSARPPPAALATASLPGPAPAAGLDLEVVLRAAAVMFAVERERIAQRFRFVPLPVRGT